MFSIPLRRALVTGSDLPFPEGCAAAEVLKVGSAEAGGAGVEESRAGLAALLFGSVDLGRLRAARRDAARAEEAGGWFRVGPDATNDQLQPVLRADRRRPPRRPVGGHRDAVRAGPRLRRRDPAARLPPPRRGRRLTAAPDIWKHEVRFIGAGVIGAAALWTLGKLIVPIAKGLAEAAASSRARRMPGGETLPVEERDMPVAIVGAICGALLIPIAWLLGHFAGTGPLAAIAVPLAIGGTLFVYVAGIITASVCGYMAGLVGSSNSPVSGVGILAILGAALLLALFVGPTAATAPHLVAFALFATAIVFSAATIANDNLQDLKTGQLVGATPWKQQVALMVGVVAGR